MRVRIGTVESELGNGSLTIEAMSEDMGDATSTIEAAVECEAIQMLFNAQYLSETLAAITTAEVALETTLPEKPGVLKPVGGARQTYIVMPLHTER